MEKIDKNKEKAFPVYKQNQHTGLDLIEEGMNLRDYFAAKMMASLILHERFCGNIESDVEFAYKIADEMLKQRKH